MPIFGLIKQKKHSRKSPKRLKLLVRVLNSLIFLVDVKSLPAGAGFERATYEFEDRTSEFPNLLKL